LELISKALAKTLQESPKLRTLLKEQALKKIDFQYECYRGWKVVSSDRDALYNNGVYQVFWREEDGGSDDCSVGIQNSLVKLSKIATSGSPYGELVEGIVSLGIEVYKYASRDEPLSQYEVTWWTTPGTEFANGGFVVYHTYSNPILFLGFIMFMVKSILFWYATDTRILMIITLIPTSK